MAGNLAIVTSLLAGACSQASPTQPSQPSVTGVWVGQYRVYDCSSVGGDFRHCGDQILYGPYSIRLSLTQNDSRVSGTAVVANDFGVAAIEVRGSVDATGSMTLSGSSQAISSIGITIMNEVTILNWSTQGTATAITGRFEQTTAGYYSFPEYRFTSRLQCELTALTRS